MEKIEKIQDLVRIVIYMLLAAVVAYRHMNWFGKPTLNDGWFALAILVVICFIGWFISKHVRKTRLRQD